jgi:hypothetical protein
VSRAYGSPVELEPFRDAPLAVDAGVLQRSWLIFEPDEEELGVVDVDDELPRTGEFLNRADIGPDAR